MTITGIKDAVQTLLAGSDYFVSVIPAPEEGEQYKFAGYPSASHYYADAAPDYATVTQNRRVLQYVVEVVLVPDKATTSIVKFAEAYALIDNIMDLFDQSIDLNGACDILRPVPGQLTPTLTTAGVGLLMTFRLFCEADITFRNN